MKSFGTLASCRSLKKLSQDSGRRERITSPVASSWRMKTSLPSKRKSAGRRTAWLRPLRKSFAVRGMGILLDDIYHDRSQEVNSKTRLLPFQRNVPDAHVRPQFVLAVAAILQSLAQPAAGF